jgi:hypothetical protein
MKPFFLYLNCWYFWFTNHNTTIPQVRNLFSAIAVFISFPLVRAAAAAAAADFSFCCCCAPPPHPAPPPLFFWGGKHQKKENRL